LIIPQIIIADAIQGLKTIPDKSVNMCVSSPPYYGLRDYGIDGQIGCEPSPDEYIQRLVDVFREVRRVLRDDATVWIVIGDSYAGSGKGVCKNKEIKSKAVYRANVGDSNIMIPKKWDGIKPKDALGIPWALAFALRADGWFLRQDIIWEKKNAMPESVKDRCTKSHEYIFLLSKSARYYFNSEAIREPCNSTNIDDFIRRKTLKNKGHGFGSYEEVRPDLCRGRDAYMPADFRRNKRSVWTVNTKPFSGAHFATYPPDLIRPCILAGCPQHGTVLDPFFGSGTTAEVCTEENRNYIGIEINPEYVKIAKKRIEKTQNNILINGTAP